ncbi:hypothetical protein D7B24_006607 [Verticillium nonalfalfae]|uniref:Uncharacterized protein n=1 Tax=Verticillium nonalfalfae TaxID=1051616 RepID=A0A3M9Y9L4_9PEZI|nr:uncharacterized protein D7B24_006607 [Verticillium nonalfalfae]RNJ56961.1 hypothetical protein D7B24_006607 [Verticillium nonalfalfae]
MSAAISRRGIETRARYVSYDVACHRFHHLTDIIHRTAAVYGGSLEKPTPLSTNVIDPCWQMDDHDLATVSMVNMRNKITERDEILRLMYGRLTPGGAVTVREFVWIPPSEVPSDRPDSKPAGKLLSHMDAQGEAKDLPLLAYPDTWRELKNAGFTGLQENTLGPYPVEGLIEKIEGIVKEQIDWEVLPFSDSRYEILSRVENDLKRTKLFI